MKLKIYQIHFRKEALKFSASHMTVFPDGSKEGLHGHNYTTEITFDIIGSEIVPFSEFKRRILTICQKWDEKVLIAQKNPFYQESKSKKSEVEFFLCGKRYVLPRDEVVFLPIDNISSEKLAEEFCNQLVKQFSRQFLQKKVSQIQVRIDESSGQGASYYWSQNQDV